MPSWYQERCYEAKGEGRRKKNERRTKGFIDVLFLSLSHALTLCLSLSLFFTFKGLSCPFLRGAAGKKISLLLLVLLLVLLKSVRLSRNSEREEEEERRREKREEEEEKKMATSGRK